MIDIPVVIPWRNDNNVAKAYNDIMKDIQDWCFILDHDVLMLNPDWYRICCRAAETLGRTSGWISGRTSANATRSPTQMDHEAPRNHDIMAHMRHAKMIYARHKETLVRFDNPTVMSGFMILTNRWTWERVGGFDQRAADSYYHWDMLKHGIDAHILPGLYMYHLHRNKDAWHKF